MRSGLVVLFEDDHCLAVWKPAGQFTQGTWAPPGEKTLEQEVREHLNPIDPPSAYVGIVHRLDRLVSGVLIWAKNIRAARRLSSQFERRTVAKEYWAIVELNSQSLGTDPVLRQIQLSHNSGEWQDWLTAAGTSGVVRAVESGEPGARQAITRFRHHAARALPVGCGWLRLWPATGRTHQLRVQTAIRGFPILGDQTYGARKPFSPGIGLHARSLCVRHPVLHSPLELVAPLPSAWASQGIVLPAETADRE
jgi:23S rRNA pseudouridine1911/1915/1917 synthase